MRTGTTSWIDPSRDLEGNVTQLAGSVEDIELVLFDVKGYGNNLPDRAAIRRLAALAEEWGHTYTVHLPQDLCVDEDGTCPDGSIEKARQVIELTRDLHPWAYVAHLNGDALLDHPSPSQCGRWRRRAEHAARIVTGWLEDPARLAVENIERWDAANLAPVLEALPVSRCVDIGHLWLQRVDPLEHLNVWLDRTRVVHLHGLRDFPAPAGQVFQPGLDHTSLARIPPAALDPVAACLTDRFEGVLTLEVFSIEDFDASRAAWDRACRRVSGGPPFRPAGSGPFRRKGPAPG